MRGCLILSVLALAGCGEHLGWNPNYNFAPTRYGEYRATREAALVTGADAPAAIPVARPFYAPTAAQIAGRNPVPIPPTMRAGEARIFGSVRTAPRTAPARAAQTQTQTQVQAPVVIVPRTLRADGPPPL